jgi:hypothetical protein
MGNGVWISLLSFVPLLPPGLPPQLRFGIYLLMAAYLGLRGNELAWRARKWESIEKFRQAQQQWVVWGVITATILAFVIAPVLMNTPRE